VTSRAALLLAVLASSSVPLLSQTLQFEAVSVKPNKAIDGGGMISPPTGSQLRVINVPLRTIINYSYNRRALQVVDAPEWTTSERFDITATYPMGASHTVEEARAMLQNVLARRFGLRVHSDTRELPIYRLMLARQDRRLGPNLTASDVDCVKYLADKNPQIIGTPPVGPGGARPACMMVQNRTYIMAGTRSMQELALALESVAGRRIVDDTQLSGNFDINVQWTLTPGLDIQTIGSDTAAGTLSLFTALQEQLGLKLEPSRGRVEVLVVDHVERPTEN
jgi:uncharacterized protein (TIGR03435 family)